MPMAQTIVSGGLLLMLCLFAQAEAAGPAGGGDVLSVNWEQFTALGILAVVVVSFVLRVLPHHTEKMVELAGILSKTVESMQASQKEVSANFAATLKEVSGNFASTLDRVCERDDAHQLATTEVLRQLTANCASRGTPLR